MRKENAFTLIELLVVIAIIALLVSILVPSLTRAKDMARKAVCSTTMNSHGKSMAMYLSSFDSYPHLSPWPWMSPNLRLQSESGPTNEVLGWPTFYAVLEMSDVKGSVKTTWGNWYYGGSVDQVWDGCLCPAMDAPSIWEAQDNAESLPDFGTYGSPLWWMSFHKWAVGYQWNHHLRAATPMGRFPSRPGPGALWGDLPDCYQWIMGVVGLLNEPEPFYIQAVNPDELSQPADIAQAWDGWDLESTPNIPWMTVTQRRGSLTPGWHGGPERFAARAALNGARHRSCPNILYADAHVASDANRPIDQVDDGLSDDYAGLRAYTWSNYDSRTFGNLNHILPMCEFAE